MGEVITLKSTAAGNLEQLVQVANSIGQLDFFEGTLEKCKQYNALFIGEYERLKEAIHTKRLKLAEAEKKAAKEVSGPGLYCFTSEMGEQRPNCQIEAMRSYYGKHYHIYTQLLLKGRGIEFVKVLTEHDASESACRVIGCNEYLVTACAFEKLKKQYSISMEVHLD